ncbi:MAG: hypothetical protein GXX85_17725 [Ignavibacteria bacterium]|nr:hypothetical protein [Ignavibacteria bacterium]
MKAKVKEMFEIKSLSDTPAPIKVNNVKTAKRLLSRLIYDLQDNSINGQKAKDLCYLLSVFIQVFNQSELEERINKLEKAKNEKL